MNRKTPIGIIGCGNISSIYLKAPRLFDILEVGACGDIDMERARSQAGKYGVPKVYTVEELLADPEVEIVVNLTVPNTHAEVALKAIAAGKAVYSEKPLATRREDGKAILEVARARQVRVGNAPDTFLGGGFQTCLKFINDGQIRTPAAATALTLNHGMEYWHPDPYFFYQPGACPMFYARPFFLTPPLPFMGPIPHVTPPIATH